LDIDGLSLVMNDFVMIARAPRGRLLGRKSDIGFENFQDGEDMSCRHLGAAPLGPIGN